MSGHKDRFERYGPDGPFDDRTGNGIVNNGPEHELGGLGEALDGDEQALRRLLQGAVQDLEPTDGALDHLRTAVPARRARKRQALVGVAAAALLMGTAVPAFVHVANSNGSDSANPVNAGHGEQAQGGTGSETGDGTGMRDPDGPGAGGQGTSQHPGGASPSTGSQPGTGTGDGATGGTALPPGTMESNLPACDAAQLGAVSAQLGQPDADGKVYGTFRIANVSGTECAVSGDGHGRLPGPGRGRPREDQRDRPHGGRRRERPARPLAGARRGGAEALHGVRGEVRLGPQRHLPHHPCLTRTHAHGRRLGGHDVRHECVGGERHRRSSSPRTAARRTAAWP